MTLKGWRTIGYQALSTIAVVTGVAITVNLTDLGFTAATVAWTGAGIKIVDAVVNTWLRIYTTTPYGTAE